jgi:hypothetical protein
MTRYLLYFLAGVVLGVLLAQASKYYSALQILQKGFYGIDNIIRFEIQLMHKEPHSQNNEKMVASDYLLKRNIQNALRNYRNSSEP